MCSRAWPGVDITGIRPSALLAVSSYWKIPLSRTRWGAPWVLESVFMFSQVDCVAAPCYREYLACLPLLQLFTVVLNGQAGYRAAYRMESEYTPVPTLRYLISQLGPRKIRADKSYGETDQLQRARSQILNLYNEGLGGDDSFILNIL